MTTLNDGSTGGSSLIFFDDSSFFPVNKITDIVIEPTNYYWKKIDLIINSIQKIFKME